MNQVISRPKPFKPIAQNASNKANLSRSSDGSIGSGISNKQQALYCVFCKKNGELARYYTTHKLRDENGLVCCPVLKKYTCPKCNVTGDHTASYCTLAKSSPRNRTPSSQSSAETKRTRTPVKTAPNRFEATPPNVTKSLIVDSALAHHRKPDRSLAEERTSATHPTAASASDRFDRGITSGISELVFAWMLEYANKLEVNMRLPLFQRYNYNPRRLEIITEAAYLAQLSITMELMEL